MLLWTPSCRALSNSNYAYALDDPYEQTIDGTKYTFIKAWDGTKEVTFKSEDTNTGITKRTAFEYSNNSDGTVDLTRLDNKTTTGVNGEYYALTKYHFLRRRHRRYHL